jgi:hypothetical protein
MVLMTAQTTLFFEDPAQMAIPNPTVLELVNEGINTVDDLAFGAKSQKRLIVACKLVRYYETVGRRHTAENLQWNTVMKNFEIQWKALMDKKSRKWNEAFCDILHRCVGIWNVPIIHVIQDKVAVPAVIPAMMARDNHTLQKQKKLALLRWN